MSDHSELRARTERAAAEWRRGRRIPYVALPEVVLGLLDEIDDLRSHTILWRGSCCPCPDDDCPIEA